MAFLPSLHWVPSTFLVRPWFSWAISYKTWCLSIFIGVSLDVKTVCHHGRELACTTTDASPATAGKRYHSSNNHPETAKKKEGKAKKMLGQTMAPRNSYSRHDLLWYDHPQSLITNEFFRKTPAFYNRSEDAVGSSWGRRAVAVQSPWTWQGRGRNAKNAVGSPVIAVQTP